MRTVCLQVNGCDYERSVEPRLLLSDFLRHELGLKGTHVGCEHGVCGCCTVHVDGAAVTLLPLVRGPGRRRSNPHHRGACPRMASSTRSRQRSASATASSAGSARPASSWRSTTFLEQNPRPDLTDRGGSRGHLRQPLPLHRVPEHRRGGEARRAHDVRRRPMSDARLRPAHQAERGSPSPPADWGASSTTSRRTSALHVAFFRSPLAHARIARLDVSSGTGAPWRRRRLRARRSRRARHRAPAA